MNFLASRADDAGVTAQEVIENRRSTLHRSDDEKIWDNVASVEVAHR